MKQLPSPPTSRREKDSTSFWCRELHPRGRFSAVSSPPGRLPHPNLDTRDGPSRAQGCKQAAVWEAQEREERPSEPHQWSQAFPVTSLCSFPHNLTMEWILSPRPFKGCLVGTSLWSPGSLALGEWAEASGLGSVAPTGGQGKGQSAGSCESPGFPAVGMGVFCIFRFFSQTTFAPN